MQTFFQNNKQWAKCLTMNYFHRKIPVLVGTMSSWLKKLISGGGGAAIRMNRYAFFEKLNSRGGDVYSGLESTQTISVFVYFTMKTFLWTFFTRSKYHYIPTKAILYLNAKHKMKIKHSIMLYYFIM